MTRARRGVVLPLVLLALAASALAAAGAAWTAQALATAERRALEAEAAWRAADLLATTWRCRSEAPGTTMVHRSATASGLATVRERHAAGGCWITVAVGDTVPLVGVLLTEHVPVVTPEANSGLVALPSIEAVAELATRSPAMSSGPSPVVAPGVQRVRAWRDLR